jgi:hypothetical protein
MAAEFGGLIDITRAGLRPIRPQNGRRADPGRLLMCVTLPRHARR